MEQQAKKPDDERRVHDRATLRTSIHFGSESNFYAGFTNDISEGGLFVATHNVVEMGRIIDLEFSLPDSERPIKVKGEVRWYRMYNPDSDGSPGIGVKFINLKEHDRNRIEKFVKLRETLFFDDEL